MNGASAGKKICGLLNAQLPEWGEEKVEGCILEVKGVDFSYDGKRNVLQNVDMTFNKGMTAIVGESGSGKSTVVNLIAGALRPCQGRITIGGKRRLLFAPWRGELQYVYFQ